MTRFVLAILLAAACALLASLLIEVPSLDDEVSDLELVPVIDDPAVVRVEADEALRVEATEANDRAPGHAGATEADRGLAKSPAGTIAGRVLDADGRPVAYATVEADGVTHESDADGRFEIAAQRVTRIVAYREDQRGEGMDELLAQPGGAPVELVLRSQASLTVAVRQAGAYTTPGIEVVVSGRHGVRRLTNGGANPLRFDDLTPGPVRVEAIGPHGVARPLAVQLRAGEVHKVDLELLPARTVAGTVRDAESGKAIAGARVLVSGMGFPVRAFETDAEGRIHGLVVPTASDFTVRVTKRGYEGALASYDAGTDAATVQLELASADDLTGYVVDAAGNPVSRARVHLVGATNVAMATATTDAEGAYTLPRPSADDPFAQVIATQGFAWGAVAIDAGDTLAAIRMQPAGTIAGLVEDLPPTATLRLRPEVGPMGDAQPLRPEALSAAHALLGAARTAAQRDSAGAFRFDPVPAGVYRLEIDTAEGVFSPLREIVVAGGPVDLGRIALDGARVAGVVTDLGGQPLAGARVVVQEDHLEGRVRQLVTDADGRFAVIGLAEGAYRVHAALPGYGPRSALIDVPTEGAVTLELGETVALLGHVADADGGVTGTATLRLYDLLAGHDHARTRRVYVTDGTFRLDALRAGEYRVELVMDDGRTLDAGQIGLLPGLTGELHFAL